MLRDFPLDKDATGLAVGDPVFLPEDFTIEDIGVVELAGGVPRRVHLRATSESVVDRTEEEVGVRETAVERSRPGEIPQRSFEVRVSDLGRRRGLGKSWMSAPRARD